VNGLPRDPFIANPLVQHPPLQGDQGVIVNQPVQSATINIGYQGPSTDTDAAARMRPMSFHSFCASRFDILKGPH
jgi:hypothetical protein